MYSVYEIKQKSSLHNISYVYEIIRELPKGIPFFSYLDISCMSR